MGVALFLCALCGRDRLSFATWTAEDAEDAEKAGSQSNTPGLMMSPGTTPDRAKTQASAPSSAPFFLPVTLRALR